MAPPTRPKIDQTAARNIIQQLCDVLGVDITVPPAPTSKNDETIEQADNETLTQVEIPQLSSGTAAAVQSLLSAASLVNGGTPVSLPSVTNTPSLPTPRMPSPPPTPPTSSNGNGTLTQYSAAIPSHLPPPSTAAALPQPVYPILEQAVSNTVEHRRISLSPPIPTNVVYSMSNNVNNVGTPPEQIQRTSNYGNTNTSSILPLPTNVLPSTNAVPPPPAPSMIPTGEHPPAILSSSPDGQDAILAQRIFVEKAIVVECGDEVLEAKAAIARAAVYWFSQNRGSLRTCRGGLGGTQTRFDINCGVQTSRGRCKLSIKFAFLARSRRRSRSCMNIRFVNDHSCTKEESLKFHENAPMRVRRAHLTRTQFDKLQRKPGIQAISKHQARRLASDRGKRGRKSLVPEKYSNDLRILVLKDINEKTATILAQLRDIHCVNGISPDDWPGDVRLLSKITRLKRTLRD